MSAGSSAMATTAVHRAARMSRKGKAGRGKRVMQPEERAFRVSLRGLYECGRLVVGDLVAAGGDVHDEEAAVVVALDIGADLSRS
jgi:hypothetical protein